MKLEKFETYLLEQLRDREFAAAYLQDAWEDSPEEFERAVRQYLAANHKLNGDPITLPTFAAVMREVGLRLTGAGERLPAAA